MNLPRTPASYSTLDQDRLRQELEQANEENLKRGRDVEMGSARIILSSPDGSRFALSVANDGTLTAVAA